MPERIEILKGKIRAYFEGIPVNEPVAIREIELATEITWPTIKKVLLAGDLNIHFKQSGNTWIAWKSTEHVGKKSGDTCAKFLKESEPPTKN